MKLPFDAEAAEKFLKVIYYVLLCMYFDAAIICLEVFTFIQIGSSHTV